MRALFNLYFQRKTKFLEREVYIWYHSKLQWRFCLGNDFRAKNSLAWMHLKSEGKKLNIIIKWWGENFHVHHWINNSNINISETNVLKLSGTWDEAGGVGEGFIHKADVTITQIWMQKKSNFYWICSVINH